MRDLYKRTFDDIILEDAEKDKVKALFLQADLRKEDTKMKTKKRIQEAAVCAAALAVILLANMLYSTSWRQGTQNCFTVLAYARELTKGGEVYSTEYESKSSGICGSGDDVNFGFGFPVKCEGKNIDTITYSIQNGIFVITNPAGESIVVRGQEPEQYLEVMETFHYPVQEQEPQEDADGLRSIVLPDYEVKQYHSFTVDYEHQDDVMTVVSVADTSDSWEGEKLNQYKAFGYNLDREHSPEEELEIRSFFTKDMGITCTVTYKDGTTETKNIEVTNKLVNVPGNEAQSKKAVTCFGIK